MTQVTAMFSDHSVIFYDEDFNSYEADESNPGYAELIAELKKANPDLAKAIALTKPINAIRQAVSNAVEGDYLPAGKVSVTINEIRYDGEVVEGALVDRILWMLSEGFDIMPMVRFLENLFLNPADFARDELYLWLETSDLPITEDGYFLAYKRVNADFTSIHDNRTMNVPGTTVQMPRQNVDPVRDRTCSRGLHFCSKSYLPNFGSNGNGYATVILKINPADVVSIPSDYNNAKGRAWKYEVLKVVEGDPETMIWPAVVGVDGGVYVVNNPADEPGYVDDDYEDDEIDYWADLADDDDDDDGYEDDSYDFLEFPSELAGALFAAYAEIAEDPKDRQTRLDWASEVLYGYAGGLDSFTSLTQIEAGELIEEAHAFKSEIDEQAEGGIKQAQIDAINSYGIVTLRRLTGKWKGHKAQDLRNLLIAAL